MADEDVGQVVREVCMGKAGAQGGQQLVQEVPACPPAGVEVDSVRVGRVRPRDFLKLVRAGGQ